MGWDRLVRERLIKRYGSPQRVESASILRVLGKREEIHPRDTAAFLYPSEEAERLFSAVNHRYYGHDILGPIKVEDGIIAVVDFRKALMDLGENLTDPALPDNVAAVQIHEGPRH